MSARSRHLPLLAAVLLLTAACAAVQAPPTASSGPAGQGLATAEHSPKAPEKQADCGSSGSRLQRDRAGKCPPSAQPVRSISREEIESTGQINMGEALKRLDPRFH